MLFLDLQELVAVVKYAYVFALTNGRRPDAHRGFVVSLESVVCFFVVPAQRSDEAVAQALCLALTEAI